MNTCWLDVIKLAGELIIAGSALTGAIVAVVGLGAWRRQLKGQSEYTLSKRLLSSLYEYRDVIARVRHPLMWGTEMPDPSVEEKSKMNRQQIHYYGRYKAYQSRWQQVQEIRQKLYPDIIEAEVLWDNDLSPLLKPLFQLETDLFIAIEEQMELENPDVSELDKEHLNDNEQRKKRRELLAARFSRKDAFDEEFTSKLKNVSEYLKKHLSK